jgi:TRAP-type mannitol/chloroaromatic compound transport system permease small subunit
LIGWEVFSQPLRLPPRWVLDAQIMLYGVLFMMAGLTRGTGHVRDVLCGFLSRTQAIIDLTLYIIFLPGVVALTLAGRMPDRWRSGSRPSTRTRSRSTPSSS